MSDKILPTSEYFTSLIDAGFRRPEGVRLVMVLPRVSEPEPPRIASVRDLVKAFPEWAERGKRLRTYRKDLASLFAKWDGLRSSQVRLGETIIDGVSTVCDCGCHGEEPKDFHDPPRPFTFPMNGDRYRVRMVDLLTIQDGDRRGIDPSTLKARWWLEWPKCSFVHMTLNIANLIIPRKCCHRRGFVFDLDLRERRRKYEKAAKAIDVLDAQMRKTNASIDDLNRLRNETFRRLAEEHREWVEASRPYIERH